jgi:hypothetical protein
VPTLRLTAKEICKIRLGFFNHLGELDNPWHDRTLLGRCAPCELTRNLNEIAHFDKAS